MIITIITVVFKIDYKLKILITIVYNIEIQLYLIVITVKSYLMQLDIWFIAKMINECAQELRDSNLLYCLSSLGLKTSWA